MEKLRELIRQAIAEILDEDNVTGGGEAYLTKFAFSKGGKNRATKTAEKLGMKVVNEVSYRSFTKTVSEVTPERKISKAIVGIKKRLREVNQIVDYSIRLRNENSLTTENYLTNSIRGLEEITTRLTELDKKIKNLKE
jgi:sugar phosphate isomerase/epimerase